MLAVAFSGSENTEIGFHLPAADHGSWLTASMTMVWDSGTEPLLTYNVCVNRTVVTLAHFRFRI